jgi:hypothetical protein
MATKSDKGKKPGGKTTPKPAKEAKGKAKENGGR